jgi:hypothetical protein
MIASRSGTASLPWGDTYATAVVARGLAADPSLLPAGADVVEVHRAGSVERLDAAHPRRAWMASPQDRLRLTAIGKARCRLHLSWIGARPRAVPGQAARIVLVDTTGAVLPTVTLTRGHSREFAWVVRVPRALDYACVSIPLPAGVNVLAATAQGSSATAMTEGAWATYFTHLPAGDHRITLRVVGDHTGDLGCPKPRLWPMYGDDIGISATMPTRWQVVD